MTKDKQLKMVEEDIIEMEDDMATTELTVRTSNTLEVKREQLDWSTLMEMSEVLAKSTIIPVSYQNRMENVMIALDLASRIGVSPMFVMQNLYIIQGKPSWSGTAVASLIKSSGQFRNVELVYIGIEGKDDYGAYVTAERNGRVLKGTVVTIGMAKREGWFQKSGSKWQTMGSQMLGYRAYSYFGRLYCPEILMGLHETSEVEDVLNEPSKVVNPYDKK